MIGQTRAKRAAPEPGPRRRVGAAVAPNGRAQPAFLPHTTPVIAILGGLGAALFWATSTLTSSRSGRLIGPTSTCAWMMVIGVLLAGPLAIASGPMPDLSPSLWVWLAGSGIGGVVGLLLTYRALGLGKVGVVAAITSTEGAIAAVLSVVAGERLTLPVAVVLVVLAGGVALVAFATGEVELHEHTLEEARRGRTAALLAAVAALSFGISIFSTAQLGKSLSPFAAVLPVRIAGVLGVFVPMAVSGRLRLTRPAVPMVILIGACEIFGNASYVAGTTQSIAVTAVLASQFAGLAAIAAFLIFRESLTSRQRSGMVAIAAGVAFLALVRG
jgi:drug/metabolite transporter (DMT)-like permease